MNETQLQEHERNSITGDTHMTRKDLEAYAHSIGINVSAYTSDPKPKLEAAIKRQELALLNLPPLEERIVSYVHTYNIRAEAIYEMELALNKLKEMNENIASLLDNESILREKPYCLVPQSNGQLDLFARRNHCVHMEKEESFDESEERQILQEEKIAREDAAKERMWQKQTKLLKKTNP